MKKDIFKQELEDWNLNAPFYASETESPFQDVLDQEKIETYSLSSKEKFVLDLGAGTGYFAHKLQGLGKKIIAVDFSLQMAKVAKSKYPNLEYKVASAESLPFHDEMFDVVIANGILHHLKAQGILSETLSEIRRVLKKGGYFCFLDRNGSLCSNLVHSSIMFVKGLIEKFKGKFPSSSSRNEALFDENDLEIILKNGFRLIDRRFVSSLPFFLLIVITNSLQYFIGNDVSLKVKRALTPLARLFERTINWKFLTVEQCVKLRKLRKIEIA